MKSPNLFDLVTIAACLVTLALLFAPGTHN